jgi:hypothetical protein
MYDPFGVIVRRQWKNRKNTEQIIENRNRDAARAILDNPFDSIDAISFITMMNSD